MGGIWVYAQMTDGALDQSALELLSKARSLQPDIAAVALGAGAGSATDELAAYGARTVFVDDDPVYDDYVAEPAAYALAELARAHRPVLILFSPTFDSRDVAGRLQAMLGCTLMANADDLLAVDRVRTRVALSVWPGRPGNLRGGVGGAKVVDVALSGPDPKLVIPRAKAFDAVPCGADAEIGRVELSIPDELKRTKRVKRHRDARSGPSLEHARVVVAGGRGLQDPANFALLDRLAKAIGDAAVGASRPVVDAGWMPFSVMIGQTGKTVKPEVYLAVGISGATQHVVAMKDAKIIIAINKDRNAPIFQIADLGIVGDALEVVPALLKALEGSGKPAAADTEGDREATPAEQPVVA
ncbi:MAG: electron transfer flavoprotein subunit alpha/FixB family protein [Solirubrobacteraceae bacterium]